MLTVLAFLTLQVVAQTTGQSTLSDANPDSATHPNWAPLQQKFGEQLIRGLPYAQPCFSEGFNSTACNTVRAAYTNEGSRANTTAAYIHTQWETCQTTSQQCLLNFLDLNDSSPTKSPQHCQPGSVPSYFIDVKSADDVQYAFQFAKSHQVPLVIRNTGHDYEGRSSAPGSLALWTHHLKNISYNTQFVPQGCSKASPGITVGAGVQWEDAYAFADSHNITIVGGSDKSVGVAGGWLQGGGHSALSNTMGLGVDRVLQYKVVTPDGHLRIANSCQNQDLFFALRGGGGGTFGVVLEATVLASPPVQLQTVIVSFTSQNTTLSKELWQILADSALTWADQGWGGFSMSNLAILINPVMSKDKVSASMKPLLDFAATIQDSATAQDVQVVVTEFPTWKSFFDAFTSDHVASVGSNLAISSRLIPKSSFSTSQSRESLVNALLSANTATPGLIILLTAPASFKPTERTSVTPAWRDSIYHVTAVATWNWNATTEEKKASYRKSSASIDNLRKITPDAAYVNEADVYEPNYQEAFWGDNYAELLQIKNKYDPDHLLDCWHCVGWNPRSSRYSCYLDV
ncbi:FAD-binding domain-containing protein [Pluteus cervinus]|uniref:FAD-binding domain-containing protein n=1 Tax=Pluteus cervinus TaxID=181527 RepID=A0ACD3AQ49_9AGAR|nr:FAD-binding domain-containing protein [Pluteus cervinus]